MPSYYRVFDKPTQADYQNYLLQAGNAEPQGTDMSYEGWLARQGRGKHLLKTSNKAKARALARETGGSFLGINPVGSGLGGAFDQISGGIGDLLDEPGVQALLLAGAGGAAMGGAFGGGGFAGTGAGAGLTEEAAMLGIGDAGISGGLTAAGGAVPASLAEEAAMLGIGDASSAAPWGLSEEAAMLGIGDGGTSSMFPSIGGSALAGAGGLWGMAKDIFGGVKDMLPSADTALAMAPILAAINYAKNTDPFDTSRLRSIYNEFDPSSLAYEYDQNTGAGRSALTSSLQNRGVMGSSFGNMDLTNFQTSRDLGRQSLINQGLTAKGGIANSILDADVKHRALKNDLYGRSLLALGNVFGGRNQ